jgi:CCR4-NOT transcription complex subunit 6
VHRHLVMADGFNRFHAGSQYLYQNHNSGHNRNLHQRHGSPINNTRGLFQPNADAASPNRSPGTNSPAHNTYNMYGHNNHRQNHGLLNGGTQHHNFQPQMNINKNFQSQNHGHQAHHVNNQHQDHGGMNNHTTSYGNHQHTVSASTLSNSTPHFTPANLQNGTPESSGKAGNENWSEQIREYHKLKMADHKAHYYARIAPSVNRFPGNLPNMANGRGDADEPTDRRRVVDDGDEMATWDSMDLSGQGLKGIAPQLFRRYPKLKKLYLNWNKLSEIPPLIGQMRFLTVLDLSMNNLSYLPPEIGMLTNLKKLTLFDNNLVDLPYELGSLFQLESLGVEGNPMRSDYKDRIMEQGTQEMIRFLREEAPSRSTQTL